MPNYLEKEKHKFEILSDGDECWEIWLNSEKIGAFNHDEHGWAGIEVGVNLAKAIAKKIGAYVVEGEIND